MKEILDILSSAILSKYTTFTSGEGAVRKLEGVDILTNFEGNDYAGVSDTKPNSFYIRYSGKTNYVSQKRGARIQFYSAISLCRIVGIYRNGNASELLQTLINGVTGQGHNVTSSNIEPTSVFKQETNKDLTDQSLTLVAVDFEITQIINGANCTINPCDC